MYGSKWLAIRIGSSNKEVTALQVKRYVSVVRQMMLEYAHTKDSDDDLGHFCIRVGVELA